MSKIKKLFGLLLAIMMLTGVMAACQKEPATPATDQIQEATQPAETAAAEEAVVEEKPGIGPDMLLLPTMENMGDKFPGSWDNYGLIGRMMLFSRVLRLDAKLQPTKGDLAESWTVSDDGLHYEFIFKDGITWHDGVEFTPNDVVISILTALKCGQVNAVMKGALSKIMGAAEYIADETKMPKDGIEGIKVDGNKLTIDMATASGTFLLTMGQFNIFPAHIIGEYDLETIKSMNTSSYYDWPIGTGPYKLVEFVPNDYALFEYYEDYFGYEEAPSILKVKMQQMTQSDYAVNALADNIDFFHINDLGTALAALENPNYEAFYTDIYFVRFFHWNAHAPNDPIADIRVRRAIVKAIDRQALIDSLMPNQATVTNTKVPASFDYYNPDVYDLSYDPVAAKALLDEAGYDYNAEVKLVCYYADQGSANFMDAVCNYLSQVGIKASWRLITGDITAQLWGDQVDYNMAYAGLSAMAVEEAYNIYESATLAGGVQAGVLPEGFTGMDDLIHELWTCVDQTRRVEILKQMQVVESEQCLWYMPMFALRNIQVVNTARVNLPSDLVLSNEWSNYERYLDQWTLNPAE